MGLRLGGRTHCSDGDGHTLSTYCTGNHPVLQDEHMSECVCVCVRVYVCTRVCVCVCLIREVPWLSLTLQCVCSLHTATRPEVCPGHQSGHPATSRGAVSTSGYAQQIVQS